ncbi:hypothetical protein F5X68DRAFT_6736 [Plectosphaerella plurivora]|uniref:Uncharacterized protein n=1 Tax=Plectosphaerella plurivora TaxID=936078 RepID=A0A9P8VCQ4_9PEZI|nr:hypothetical protein F5X68DRAFT_6736 [Plectosphaerella plurivora]
MGVRREASRRRCKHRDSPPRNGHVAGVDKGTGTESDSSQKTPQPSAQAVVENPRPVRRRCLSFCLCTCSSVVCTLQPWAASPPPDPPVGGPGRSGLAGKLAAWREYPGTPGFGTDGIEGQFLPCPVDCPSASPGHRGRITTGHKAVVIPRINLGDCRGGFSPEARPSFCRRSAGLASPFRPIALPHISIQLCWQLGKQ